MRCPGCGEVLERPYAACPVCGRAPVPAARDVCAVSSSVPSCVSPSSLSGSYENSWAVVIGINRYRRAPALEFALADAELVCETLEDAGFGRRNIIRLFDHAATRQNIRDVLNVELARRTGVNDRVLIFFAGHGQDFVTPGGRKMGYLFPVDGDPDYLASRCISMDEINIWNEYIPAKHILYVMDCCYSGLAAVRSTGVEAGRADYMDTVMRRPVRQIITAGRADQRVFEDSGHGIFTRVFVRGIKGGADLKGRGFVTGFDLGHYLESRVYEESRGRQQPLFRYLGGDGEFVFAGGRGRRQAVGSESASENFSRRQAADFAVVGVHGAMERLERDAACLVACLHRGADMESELVSLAAGRAKDWHLAARAGVPAGLWLWGCCCAFGSGRGQDAGLALQFFLRAAEDFAPASYFAGLCFAEGQGIGADMKKAREHFGRAAGMGFAEADLALGILSMDRARGQRRAAAFFRRAARRGSVQARYNYALCRMNGRGTRANPRAGFALLLSAAEEGFRPAQFNVALCLERGIGTKADRVLSRKWMLRAAGASGAATGVAGGR